jgi:hypothetical protein
MREPRHFRLGIFLEQTLVQKSTAGLTFFSHSCNKLEALELVILFPLQKTIPGKTHLSRCLQALR